MAVLVPDTSSLVSLGVVAGDDPDPMALCLADYDVVVPETVVAELSEVAAYDDEHGRAAGRVLDRTDDLPVETVDLDAEFPLDDGENAAVTLANDVDADIFLCDEFGSLGLIHASLADTRLVTTPTLLSVFEQREQLGADGALAVLDAISDTRSWGENSYVQRARVRLDGA
jgi:predicted nucleic acid-binding protein